MSTTASAANGLNIARSSRASCVVVPVGRYQRREGDDAHGLELKPFLPLIAVLDGDVRVVRLDQRSRERRRLHGRPGARRSRVRADRDLLRDRLQRGDRGRAGGVARERRPGYTVRVVVIGVGFGLAITTVLSKPPSCRGATGAEERGRHRVPGVDATGISARVATVSRASRVRSACARRRPTRRGRAR